MTLVPTPTWLSRMSREPRYLTIKDAAARLGVSRPTLYGYIEKGLVKVREIAGRRVVVESSLKAFEPPPRGRPKKKQ